jgi:hypothetical protein
VWLQERITKKDMCLKRDWTDCSQYDNHSKLNSQHTWGNRMTISKHKILHFDSESFHMNSKNYQQSGYNANLNLLTIFN